MFDNLCWQWYDHGCEVFQQQYSKQGEGCFWVERERDMFGNYHKPGSPMTDEEMLVSFVSGCGHYNPELAEFAPYYCWKEREKVKRPTIFKTHAERCENCKKWIASLPKPDPTFWRPYF